MQSGQQLSQIEKSVTHLLVATKQLLETLTQWSRQQATEAEVSDVYVRLGYEFNIACRAFTAIGVDVTDLGNVPDLLRTILEDTLSQEASSASLDRYLPRIRDIIINLLHGLKKKQQRLRQRQAREGNSPSGLPATRNGSVGSVGSGETGLTDMLNDAQHPGQATQAISRSGSRERNMLDDQNLPPRTSSAAGIRDSSLRHDSMTTANGKPRTLPQSRDVSQTPLQNQKTPNTASDHSALPELPSYPHDDIHRPDLSDPVAAFPPPPPPPPKQQDAFAALQRGGDLERRASRRLSTYHISKHLGASPNGMPMLPPAQHSPIPNRGRDVRESMNAVRTRGSIIHAKQRSINSLSGDETPHAGEKQVNQAFSDQIYGAKPASTTKASVSQGANHTNSRSAEDNLGLVRGQDADSGETLMFSATLKGPSPESFPVFQGDQPDDPPAWKTPPTTLGSTSTEKLDHDGSSSQSQSQPFIPEDTPQPGKELTLFLQYKSKIKKFVLPDGSNDLSIARLQLAFIEKFAWNTYNNGTNLPEIYIQDSVSGVRHELEDLNDIKDRSVLVLNVEVLDEVKRHIDEGLGGIRRMVEGVRSVVDSQQSALQQVSDRQRDAAKDMAKIAATPSSAGVSARISQLSESLTKGGQAPVPLVGSTDQLSEVQNLRRDLAVVRQTYASFVADIETSMSTIKKKAGSVKVVAAKASEPRLEGVAGNDFVVKGQASLGDESEKMVDQVDTLQDIVEDLRRDVVVRGVRPLPRQLETVGRDIANANSELRKLQELLRGVKPRWTKIWEEELTAVCNQRDFLSMQEELQADLADDLGKAAATFALVEAATKEQMKDGQPENKRTASRGLNPVVAVDPTADPHATKEGVLGEVRALRPNHENRLEAIERAEKARQRELESRSGGEFKQELGSFVEQGRLKKTGGAEEAERLRKAKDDRIRKEVWERMNGIVPNDSEAPSVSLELPPPISTEGNTVSPEPEFVEAVESPIDPPHS